MRIAVLPFTNLSGDPEQDYFAEGLFEDIITGLSRIKWIFVIARNSSFAYKGKAMDVRQIGRELGVRYVLEGSVRRSANRVRITAQLIDTGSGALWGCFYSVASAPGAIGEAAAAWRCRGLTGCRTQRPFRLRVSTR